MKAISRLEIIDHSQRDKEDIIFEDHTKKRYLFGVKIFEKRYKATTEIVNLRNSSGYK